MLARSELTRLCLLAGACGTLALSACSEPLDVAPEWAGTPLPSVERPVDHRMADVGAELFSRNCAACHTIGEGQVIGPDLRGVTARRSQIWMRGMVSNPDSMLRTDSIARRLLVEYTVPMLDRRLDDGRVRASLEFLWRSDHPGGPVPAPDSIG